MSQVYVDIDIERLSSIQKRIGLGSSLLVSIDIVAISTVVAFNIARKSMHLRWTTSISYHTYKVCEDQKDIAQLMFYIIECKIICGLYG
jgi:hypothetical protein